MVECKSFLADNKSINRIKRLKIKLVTDLLPAKTFYYRSGMNLEKNQMHQQCFQFASHQEMFKKSKMHIHDDYVHNQKPI